MTVRILAAAAASVVLVCAAGCASSDNAGGNHSGHQAGTTSASPQPQAASLVIDVAIKGGNVTPTNAQFQANVGKPIELRVSSDAADELHVHSNPEHTFPVEAKPNQTFTFTVEVPGSVEVELHQRGRTVATIQVRQ